ncbi:hypothetical protein BDQ17DRAFT_1366819 [Cyathus striatus]|nr:hypothetical protein BDQ17DRAFT_1366819 [Cyathus striatus]
MRDVDGDGNAQEEREGLMSMKFWRGKGTVVLRLSLLGIRLLPLPLPLASTSPQPQPQVQPQPPQPQAAPPPVVHAKKAWTLPPAPGPTLRQRIERKEREAGLRCSEISCGIGPSDDDPVVADAETAMRQLSICESGEKGKPVCAHTFHSSCLVTAERVALDGEDMPVVGEDVEVCCPVCKGVGCVSRRDWEEGVKALL